MQRTTFLLTGLVALSACASHPAPAVQSAPAAAACPPAPAAAPVDPVLAVVEGRRIRESEVRPLVPLFSPEEEGEHLTDAERLERTLDVLIDDLVVRATATRQQLHVADSEVDATVSQVAAARGITVDALFTEIVARRVTRAQYRSMVESQLLRARLMIAQRAHASVGDAEVELAWHASPEPRTPLAEARTALRDRILEQRLTCLEHTQIADLRRRMGVEFLLERVHGVPSAEDRTLRFVPTASVVVSGNRAIPTAEILTVLRDEAHQPALGGAFIPIDDDGRVSREPLLHIHAAYYDRGYINVQVENPGERLEPCRSLVDHAMVTVREGDRFRVGALSFASVDEAGQPIAPAAGAPSVPQRLGVRPGDWFSRAAIIRGIEAVVGVDRDAGYATAHIEPDLTPHADTHLVDLRLTLRRGPRVTVERIDVAGNGATPRADIDRLVTVRAGELFNETRYEATRAALQHMGRFDRVELSTEAVEGHPDRLVVHIELHEGAPAATAHPAATPAATPATRPATPPAH